MKHIALILLALFVVACSPQKRLNRLIKKHPELVTHDTIVVRDTVIMPGDTLVKWRPVHLTQYDTVTIENERQVVRIVRMPTGSPCDTAVFQASILAAVKPDTVFREVKLPCSTVQPVKEVPIIPWWIWVIMGVLSLIILFFAGKAMSR